MRWLRTMRSEGQAGKAFPLAQASGYGMLTMLLTIAVVCEGIPMHLLLHNWSPVAAWIFTGLGIYGFVWVLALGRSLGRRPVLVGQESVLLQVGFLWRVEFRRDQISSVRRFAPAYRAPRKTPGYLSLVVMNEPQWLIELKEPVVAVGPLGVRKTVTRVAVAVDDREGFGVALGADQAMAAKVSSSQL